MNEIPSFLRASDSSRSRSERALCRPNQSDHASNAGGLRLSELGSKLEQARCSGAVAPGRILAALLVPILLVAGCPPQDTDASMGVGFNNTTDATNGGSSYIGSAACVACHTEIHPEIIENIGIHGHSNALTPIRGAAPSFPDVAPRAKIPNPPAGHAWTDISYIISGYIHGAFFVDSAGYIMTTGVDGVDTQYNLEYPPNGTEAGFVPYKPDQATPLPFGYDRCFKCHTTGPQPQTPDNPLSQDGRPGIEGTWEEVNITCEACHGPGSRHAPNPQRRDIFVPTSTTLDVSCGRCHAVNDDPDRIYARDGYVRSNSQYAELLASGGHADFACMVCHNPHASMVYDREDGWRNECSVCHGDQNMAFHEGYTFVRGDYEERIDCQSCHMPYTGLSNSTGDADVVGTFGGRMADVRGHIFRIDTENDTYEDMFTEDGQFVQKDAQGRAAVTVDFVCLRCHSGTGNVFPLTPAGARRIADGIHARRAVVD